MALEEDTMSATTTPSDMPYRVLGRTGERVSAIGLGGWHLALKHVEEPLSIRIIRTAIDRGINFMDNSWDYNEGESELRMGKALRDGYREKVFLMTKIDGRSKKEAARQLDESLRRLQTDRIDLVQHHEVLRYEDPHRIFDERRRQRGAARGAQGGQAPLHRLHRPQGPAHPPAHARGRARSTASRSTPCRCRSTSWTRTTAASRSWCCPSW